MSWYAITYTRRLSRASGPIDLSKEECFGPYRWRWLAALKVGGTWCRFVNIFGQWYMLGSKVVKANNAGEWGV